MLLCIIKNKFIMKENKRSKFWEWFRYWVLFNPLHFLCYNLQFAIDETERDEFMKRFHRYDVMD